MDLPPSIERLCRLIGNENEISPELAESCLRRAEIEPEDLAPWTDFEHPVSDSYGRKLVYDGGFFEVMVMSWVAGDFSAIHDHGSAQWGAVRCFGRAEHAIFSLDDNLLTTRCRTPVEPDEINAVDHALIHQLGNLDQPPFCSLHVYGSYDHGGEITGDARIFDLFEGKVQLTDGGVFFCLPETDIKNRQDGPEADLPTTLRHHQDMLSRIQRMQLLSEDLELLLEKARALEQSIHALERSASAA